MTDKNEFNLNMDPIPTSTKESLFNPTAQAVGQGVGGVASFISIPFRGLGLWSENVIDKMEKKIVEKNQEIPEGNRDFSKFQQTAKAIDDAKYSLGEEELQDLFTNLISSTLDNRKNTNIHPSFSSILKEFTSLDATIFKKIYIDMRVPVVSLYIHEKDTSHGVDIVKNKMLFEDSNLSEPIVLNSLSRLGLIDIKTDRFLVAPIYEQRYDEFAVSELYKEVERSLPVESHGKLLTEIQYKKGHIALTDIGKKFGDIIIDQ